VKHSKNLIIVSVILIGACKPEIKKAHVDKELAAAKNDLRTLYVSLENIKEISGEDEISLNQVREDFPKLGILVLENGVEIEMWNYHAKSENGIIATTVKKYNGAHLELREDGSINHD